MKEKEVDTKQSLIAFPKIEENLKTNRSLECEQMVLWLRAAGFDEETVKWAILRFWEGQN